MKRVVLHIDMNSYFASVEQQANPPLRNKPIAVSGRPYIHSVVAAASIEAKKFGVHSGMSTWEAQRLCPQLIFIPGDPEKYIATTGKLLKIFKSYTPAVEIFSIDEVFLDLSPITTSTDTAIVIAMEIKQRIKTEIGDHLTCSIGIAPNKFLAKLASEKKKPDGLTVVTESNLDEILLSSRLEDFCGIGRQTSVRLHNMGVYSVAQLRQLPVEFLVAAFGNVGGHHLYHIARGIDDSAVIPDFLDEEQKSFSHSLTLPKETVDKHYIEAVLLHLAEKVARRMRQEHFCAKTIHTYVRFPGMGGIGESQTLATYTDDGYEIFAVSRETVCQSLEMMPARMLAVGVGNLIHKDWLSLSLLPEKIKAEKITSSMDQVNDHFGENTVFRAAVLPAFPREERVAGIRIKLRFN